jgi:hypothetical protein
MYTGGAASAAVSNVYAFLILILSSIYKYTLCLSNTRHAKRISN